MKVCSFLRYPDDMPMISPGGDHAEMDACVKRTVDQLVEDIKDFAKERGRQCDIRGWTLMNAPAVIILCSDELARALQQEKLPGLYAIENGDGPAPKNNPGPVPG